MGARRGRPSLSLALIVVSVSGCAARGPLFDGPAGIVSDGAGRLFVADSDNDTIRQILLGGGSVSTLAGTAGMAGSSDGQGAMARFDRPLGLASDGAGNLFTCDSDGQVVRQIVVASGAVSTLAGSAGTSGSSDGIGAAASFDHAEGIASDGAGNLYVTDAGNGTIRKIVIATREVTTLAGTAGMAGTSDGIGAAAQFGSPGGITYDGAGHLYVTDVFDDVTNATQSSMIRRVSIATGEVTTLAGMPDAQGSADGPAASAQFYGAEGIAGDGMGNLFVADNGNNTIRQIDIASGAVTTLAGMAGTFGNTDGTGAQARFTSPYGIASDGAGNLYVSETDTIRKIVIATGQVTTVAGVAGMAGTADSAR